MCKFADVGLPSLSETNGWVFSKGKQNKRDHEISHLSPDAWAEWKKENSDQKLRIKTEEKRRGNANKQKRQSRGY